MKSFLINVRNTRVPGYGSGTVSSDDGVIEDTPSTPRPDERDLGNETVHGVQDVDRRIQPRATVVGP